MQALGVGVRALLGRPGRAPVDRALPGRTGPCCTEPEGAGLPGKGEWGEEEAAAPLPGPQHHLPSSSLHFFIWTLGADCPPQ